MCKMSSLNWITWGVGSKVGEVTGGQANAPGFYAKGGKEQSDVIRWMLSSMQKFKSFTQSFFLHAKSNVFIFIASTS